MSRIETRKLLFEKFSKQLHLLKKEGLIDVDLKYELTYLCPICLDQFSIEDINPSSTKNFLTEEDAPPDKLGGNRIALTCKECNSTAGHEIDSHLINRIRMIDNSKFFKDTVQEGYIEFEGNKIQTEITSDGNGKLQLLHKLKNNNPTFLQKFIHKVNSNLGGLLNLNPKKIKNDSDRVNKALLKTNYIITFAKFGYIFLLDEKFQHIRDEIKKNDVEYSGHLFLTDQFNENQIGTYYVLNNEAHSIFNIFKLETGYSQTIIGAILPLSNQTPEQIHSILISNGYDIGIKGKIGSTLKTSNYDESVNLFTNIDEIKKIINWI